jgi:hypothetical protein
MIPQPFVKGAGERVFFGPYEYPTGADLIFDFGNPTCTSEFNSNRRVYNVGSANVTASLEPYNNPGPIYPVLSSANGGVMTTSYIFSGQNYMQWDWKSTELQSSVLIYKPNGAQGNGDSQYFPQPNGGANSINQLIIYTTSNQVSRIITNMYDSSNTFYNTVFGELQFNTGSLNGQNGWNAFTVTADSGSNHKIYFNSNLRASDTTTITRTTSGTQTSKLPFPGRAQIMAYLQYPKVLTPKEIRQVNKVFAQRYFL